MGKSQRDKGSRNERAVVNHWRAAGVKCDRVPLSGAHGGEYAGDVDLYVFGPDEAPLIGEVKARANGSGFKTITAWLNTNDLLILHADRESRLYVIPERVMERMVLKCNKS